jgi:hypothetical protein
MRRVPGSGKKPECAIIVTYLMVWPLAIQSAVPCASTTGQSTPSSPLGRSASSDHQSMLQKPLELAKPSRRQRGQQ